MGSCVPLETLQDRGTPPCHTPAGRRLTSQRRGMQSRSHPEAAGAGDPGGAPGGSPRMPPTPTW